MGWVPVSGKAHSVNDLKHHGQEPLRTDPRIPAALHWWEWRARRHRCVPKALWAHGMNGLNDRARAPANTLIFDYRFDPFKMQGLWSPALFFESKSKILASLLICDGATDDYNCRSCNFSAIHILIKDCRGTPRRLASLSRRLIIQEGKSTLTLLCF